MDTTEEPEGGRPQPPPPDGDPAGAGVLRPGAPPPPADTPDPAAPPRSEDGGPPGAGRGVPRSAVLVAALVVVAVVLGVVLLRGGDDEPDPSAALASTSTTIAPRKAGQVVVATARNAQIVVRSTPPDGWDGARTTIAPSSQPPPEASQASLPARPPLPRVGFAVEGRSAETGGWRFENPTVFDDPFVMLVSEGRGDWLRVEVPVRPNGAPGWVRVDDVELSRHRARVEIARGERRLRAWIGDELIADTPVVVGTDATRTPTGRFYLTDTIDQKRPEGFYGPHVLALNAYSEQLDTFDGGVPVIAIHGTNRPDQMGQAISNGCVRVPNDVVERLEQRLPLGTQVDIVP